MRTPITSALLVVIALVSFAHSAAAQSSPVLSQPQSPQQTPQRLPAGAKLLPPPPATQVSLLGNQAGSASDLTRRELKEWTAALQNQKNGLALNLQKFGSGPDVPNCAHIRIIQAPETDSEMVVQMSPGEGGPITTFQGLPPCRRDLPSPITAQRFHGMPLPPVPPRKPFVLPPASEMPSSQPLPAQRKQDPPSPKP